MVRALALMSLLPACFDRSFVGDDPAIRITGDRTGVLTITVERADPEHAFGEVRATIDGVDLGPPQYAAGYDPGWIEGPHEGAPEPATATFVVPQAQLGPRTQLEIDDDGARYVVETSTLGTRRIPIVTSSLVAPLHPGDLIAVGTGVASDSIAIGVVKPVAGATERACFSAGVDSQGHAHVPPDLAAWPDATTCPNGGQPLPVTLEVELVASPQISTCTGPSLTCAPIRLSMPTGRFDATLVF